jgi:hypothetical protein
MISLHDCIALCGLNEQEVMAIAEHEHAPEIVAAAMTGEDPGYDARRHPLRTRPW